MTVYGENGRKDGTYLFLHTPKTAGAWVASVIRQHWGSLTSNDKHHEFVGKDLGISGTQPANVGHSDFVFSYVRNPIDWYASWWKWSGGGSPYGWDLPTHPNFDEWIKLITKRKFASKMFRLFTQQNSFTGTYENLRSDLTKVGKLLGFELTEKSLELKASHVTNSRRVVRMNVATVKRIQKAEGQAFDIWKTAWMKGKE